jgi:DNA-binding NtrC family response regulator
MSRHIRILSVGPNPDILAARNATLTQAGYRIVAAHSRHQAVLLATSHFFEAALLCWTFPEDVRQRLSHDLSTISPETKVILLPRPNNTGSALDKDPRFLLQIVESALLNPP